jgi:tRNA-Thr(GGU) m(6)t(6)A37 methyltransferase TsaA
MDIFPIAHFRSPFTSKFGIPKQSGLVEELRGSIVFEPKYRNSDYIRGLEDFDFLWLIWEFSANPHRAVSPVVRPPVLGGNERVGVFATRSPFRPNPLGLSSVKIDHVEMSDSLGPVIHVLGADLMDGTPIFDIKPYIAYADSHVGVRSGFVDQRKWPKLSVVIPPSIEAFLSKEQMEALRHTLELDPRPHYQNDPQKVYGMPFEGRDIHFLVNDGVLTVLDD